jgi:hypothetical protein
MKQLIFSILLLITISSNAVTHPAKSVNPFPAKTKVDAEVMAFLNSFELQVRHHDPDNILEFMDMGYIEEQLDGMLKGDVEQFLNEFFCGNNIKTDEFKCVKYKTIKRLKRQTVVRSGDGYQVGYIIIAKGLKVSTEWFINKAKDGDDFVYGLVGAMG